VCKEDGNSRSVPKKKRKVHPKGAKEKGHMRTNEESTKEVERESNE